jgi:hypothetical protein
LYQSLGVPLFGGWGDLTCRKPVASFWGDLQPGGYPRARNALGEPQLRIRVVAPDKLLAAVRDGRAEVPPARNLNYPEALQYFNLGELESVVAGAQLALRVPSASIYVSVLVQYESVASAAGYGDDVVREQVGIGQVHLFGGDLLVRLVAQAQLAVAVCALKTVRRSIPERADRRSVLTQLYKIIATGND